VLSVNNAAVEQICPTIALAPDGYALKEIISAGAQILRVELDLTLVSNWYLDQCRADVVMIAPPMI
jgi:hypothetical protein